MFTKKRSFLRAILFLLCLGGISFLLLVLSTAEASALSRLFCR